VIPSATGLFDQVPPSATSVPAAPVQTTAEVVDTKPALAQPKEAAQPVQQALPLQPSKPVQAPAVPPQKKELTSKQKFDVVRLAFEAIENVSAVMVDKFFTQKKWLNPGQCLMELSTENIERAHKTLDQLIPIYKAWAKQQEAAAKQAAEKKVAEGGAK